MTGGNNRTTPRNIVIFGQTGAGKSSIINMLAGSPIAKVSGGASGCTLSNQSYSMPHGEDNCIFWDTAGLNEDGDGTVSSQAALQNLLNLVKDHGVNLLIYCIRARLVNIIRVNYDLFWRIICKEEVPIVLIVTGLEGKGDMDEWWRENQKTIKNMKMSFDGHACITSWKGREDRYKKEYEESAEKVWKLVRDHCRSKPWYMPPGWPTLAPREVEGYTIRTVGSQIRKDGSKSWMRRPQAIQASSHTTKHNIVLFGEGGSGKSSLVNMIVGSQVAKVSSSAEFCTFKNDRYEAIIGDILFAIYDTTGLNEGDQGRIPHWKAVKGLYTLIRQLDGVSLLIYCMRGRVRDNARPNWILFNKVICAERVPVIAVVTGLETYDDPDDWKREGNVGVLQRYGITPKAVGCVVSFRGRQEEFADIYGKSQSRLRNLIMKYYLQKPWCEEKDKWFANIYSETFSTGICFAPQTRVEYNEAMRDMINEFTKEVSMKKEDSEKLDATLLKAEKKVRKSQGRRFQ